MKQLKKLFEFNILGIDKTAIGSKMKWIKIFMISFIVFMFFIIIFMLIIVSNNITMVGNQVG